MLSSEKPKIELDVPDAYGPFDVLKGVGVGWPAAATLAWSDFGAKETVGVLNGDVGAVVELTAFAKLKGVVVGNTEGFSVSCDATGLGAGAKRVCGC